MILHTSYWGETERMWHVGALFKASDLQVKFLSNTLMAFSAHYELISSNKHQKMPQTRQAVLFDHTP